MLFKDKNIVLCVTGGIAAYKAVSLASKLKKEGANVFAVLTKNAGKFVTPLTFKTITKNKVTVDMFDESDFIPHISLSELADYVIVAPATANCIAKFANGIADDMVSTLMLSTKAKKIIVPAMNTNMYMNDITQKNISILKENNFFIMEPEEGLMACGTCGPGRFPEINKIIDFTASSESSDNTILSGKKVLITLGGTIEDIDPVRYITNRSSGKMGFSFAESFIKIGADVTLILGNVSEVYYNEFMNNYSADIVKIRSAKEMYNEVIKRKDDFDMYVMAAAVADYSPKSSENKIKKKSDALELKLYKTNDILKELPKRDNAVYIGFAAETENLLDNAKTKMINKNIHFLVANIVKGDKSAMGGDMAEVILLNRWNNDEIKFSYNSKKNISDSIILKIVTVLQDNGFFQ